MTNVSQIRREEMYARNAKYKQHRMAVPVSDEQYLFWDDVLTNHFDKALEVYERLLAKPSYIVARAVSILAEKHV